MNDSHLISLSALDQKDEAMQAVMFGLGLVLCAFKGAPSAGVSMNLALSAAFWILRPCRADDVPVRILLHEERPY